MKRKHRFESPLWILIAVVVSDIGFYVSSDANHKQKLNSKRLFIRADRLIFVTSLHLWNSNQHILYCATACILLSNPAFYFLFAFLFDFFRNLFFLLPHPFSDHFLLFAKQRKERKIFILISFEIGMLCGRSVFFSHSCTCVSCNRIFGKSINRTNPNCQHNKSAQLNKVSQWMVAVQMRTIAKMFRWWKEERNERE